MHASADATFSAAYAASQTQRTRSTTEREAASTERSLTVFERGDNANRRDEQAELRDVQAKVRERTAALRDRAAQMHERALGRETTPDSSTRAAAAGDRMRAAEDRDRAAEDRKQASLDRERAGMEIAQAQLDDLTGVYRPALGKAMLQREINRSRRTGGRMIVAYCDIDGLKQLNDEKGHSAGDALLEALADAIRSRLRSYDPVVRIGGDEFVCGLSDTDMDQARRIVREIQTTLAEKSDGASMTFGLASLRTEDSLETVLARSDEALREARLARP